MNQEPQKVAFIVGTDGDFNWQCFYAETEEQAIALWNKDYGQDGYGKPQATRRPDFDGKDVFAGSTEWFLAGLGCLCARCGNEVWGDNGAEIVKNEILCEDCAMPFSDNES